MKTIITLALLITTFIMKAQVTSEGTTITVMVPVQSSEGSVLIGLYDSQENFLKKPQQTVEGIIKNGKATATFTNVLEGTYGITLFHDKNSNKQMDFEPNGMPKEPYGVSNNVMSFGPPQWETAKFEVGKKALELEIRM